MKTVLTAAGVAASLALAATPAAFAQQAGKAQAYAQQKVAYHVNGHGGEGGRAYLGALRNAQNHLNAVGQENVDIVVVMHGNGLGLLSAALENDKLRSSISSLKGQGVRFQVCNNTLVGRGIDWESDLYDVREEDIVPSGVAQLSHLQQQGFTYLKP